ncbi:unnamed protein product [Prorocentrum cordatum]|uniref:Uncharacterized protein n=1 Tax=Prorocentrum cordatum TaxID=2364126 RepID=A0ABN9VM70_9DINO|nr:unnamed protein product [Polarella glacialis]
MSVNIVAVVAQKVPTHTQCFSRCSKARKTDLKMARESYQVARRPLVRCDAQIVAVFVRLQIAIPHLAEQRQRLPPLTAPSTRDDLSVVADDARLKLHLLHLAEKLQSPLPLLALLASADPRIVADDVGLHFASRISLSSASASCHCSLFSHALIPAL